jgi:hypothetical protein
MGTTSSTQTATKLEVQGSELVVGTTRVETTRKEEMKEPKMDWSGQRSGEELKVL